MRIRTIARENNRGGNLPSRLGVIHLSAAEHAPVSCTAERFLPGALGGAGNVAVIDAKRDELNRRPERNNSDEVTSKQSGTAVKRLCSFMLQRRFFGILTYKFL